MLTPPEFVRKWVASKGGERAVAQEHFIDLCRLLGEATPSEADPSGDLYAFEKGARRPDGEGFADVWLKDHFAWEYKGKRKDLTAAYKQVSDYREALGNPPLLIVCDIDRFEVHTNWTNTEKWVYHFANTDLLSDTPVDVSTASGPAEDAPRLTALQVLKALFENPDNLKPRKTTDQITQEAARLFGTISDELRKWKVDDMRIARFITRMLFCMFATDVGLLPRETFSEVVNVHKSRGDNEAFRRHLSELFRVMNGGGEFLMHQIPHFNGRLFEDDDVPDKITTQEIITLAKLDSLNWADVEPSIFGTLFERILDPAQRTMLGAHYTSRADMELIVEPVLMAPLRRDWEEVKKAADDYLYSAGTRGTDEDSQRRHVRSLLSGFHTRLATTRVLDPACGSGNFLYVALALLKALEKEVIAFAALHEITDIHPRVHPRQLHGIELSQYAVELASIVIWIGYLQWKHRNAMPFDDEEPILEPLDQIHLMNAIVDCSDSDHPKEPQWPEVDVVVGNPPFLGGKLLRHGLGDDYVERLFAVWDGRVARESDLCCYWFEKARGAIEAGRAKRAGLLATQGIRGGANRRVLKRIKETGDIFYAQADRKWIQDGVAVRVSMVGFDDGSETRRLLNETPDDDPAGALARALPVEGIGANLTHASATIQARRLKENLGISFMGITKVGPFDIPGDVARRLLRVPNPDGCSNADVIRPWVHGRDLNQKRRDWWIIDFPPGTTLDEAALYEAPFEYLARHVKPARLRGKRKSDAENWWIHHRPRPAMRAALSGLSRYVATSMVSKHRLFVWLPAGTLAENLVIAFARDDDYFFGVLHSRVHRVWALAEGTQLESRPRYTPTTCFETFPFPNATKEQSEAIAQAAGELNRLREGWLNPAPVDGLPLAESELKKRTLTNLYNERPTWLVNAHVALDAAVLAAYGWPADISDAEILSRLLALNFEREPE
ncbi:MAG: class I SAM-dependent DNA methyltransferase [Dehalococcoidia bacterium]|nr:class I SAM-dependent DNA methyltransferase [Dehalococcoidia bacterium]